MNPTDKSSLLVDLYQLTMAQAYVHQGIAEQEAVFEFFVRDLPPQRRFLVSCGINQLTDFLLSFRFNKDEIAYLLSTKRFSKKFIDYLKDLRFTGDLFAMPEGTLFFPMEPMIQIKAPLIQAQLIETRLINIIHLNVLLASKAARLTLAAKGLPVVDFGLRRAHGSEAGIVAARAAFVAGAAGTSTVLAGKLYDIPIFGTMAHSFVLAHESELEAFVNFARVQPDNVVLLIDTYDTLQGARNALEAARILQKEGIIVRGVRIDSGDLASQARLVRQILDEANMHEIKIFVSGNLDEYIVKGLLEQKAPIDGFGVGTKMDTSSDLPYLDCAYKLQEFKGKPKRKTSTGKATIPGRKQVYRYTEKGPSDRFKGDLISLWYEKIDNGIPLLVPVLLNGTPVARPLPDLQSSRSLFFEQIKAMPEGLRSIGPKEEAESYKVVISKNLRSIEKSL